MYMPIWLFFVIVWIVGLGVIRYFTQPEYDYDIPTMAVGFFGSIIWTFAIALVIAIIY